MFPFSKEEREQLQKDLNEIFDSSMYDPNYARKMYIIENCIYGVDIQPVATQISKLRFFISLITEQKTDPSKPNCGVRPLPNLETKFIAANTLIDITNSGFLKSQKIIELERDLKEIRHRIFSVKTVKAKLNCREKDCLKRKELAEELHCLGLGAKESQALASWDPYDKKTSSPWFNPEWMFGIKDGFDIVIGNPPYVVLAANDILIKSYKKLFLAANDGKVNLYKLFFEKGIRLLKEKGILTFITPNTYLADNGIKFRDFMLQSTIREIIEYTEKDKVFENVTQAVVTTVLLKEKSRDNLISIRTAKHGFQLLQQKNLSKTSRHYILPLNCVVQTVLKHQGRLTDCFLVMQGEINVSTKASFYGVKKDIGTLPMWRGNNIGKYIQKSFPKEYCQTIATNRIHYDKQRIILPEVSNQSLEFRTKAFISDKNYLCGHTTTYLYPKNNISLLYYLGLVNSKIFNYFFNYFSFTNHVSALELSNIPIPSASTAQQQPIIDLVDQILEKKKSDPNSDTSDLEHQIDLLVYDLYGLTDDEIAIVEGK